MIINYPITISLFILNTTLIIISFIKLYQSYAYVKYKPRVWMIAVIIFSNYPATVLVIIFDLLKYKCLDNSVICYAYALIDYTYLLKNGFIFSLTIFTFLILFSGYKTNKINKIGKMLNLVALGLFMIWVYGILTIIGFSKNKGIKGHPGLFKKCRVANNFIYNTMNYYITFSAVISFFTGFGLMVYFSTKKKFRSKPMLRRTALTFVLFAVTYTFASHTAWLTVIFKFDMEKHRKFRDFMIDLSAAVPAMFALVYLLVELKNGLNTSNMSFTKLIKMPGIKSLYMEHLHKTGNRRGLDLLSKWELLQQTTDNEIRFTNPQTGNVEDCSRKEITKLYEKELDLNINNFVLEEEFQDYYKKYRMGAVVDMELNEVRASNN